MFCDALGWKRLERATAKVTGGREDPFWDEIITVFQNVPKWEGIESWEEPCTQQN